MPYNIEGGDTPESTQFMEDCIQKVMKKGADKSKAVAICKVSFRNMKRNEKNMKKNHESNHKEDPKHEKGKEDKENA
jgi:uncharacterized protein YoaH (UPF0181 family)